MVLPTIRIILRARKLQITMEILPRVLNVKSLLSAGNVMARTMPQSVQTEKNTISNIHTVQEEMTVGELARSMPTINTTLENRQADYQTSMVEVEGMVNQTPVTI